MDAKKSRDESPRDPSADAPTAPPTEPPTDEAPEPGGKAKQERLKKVGRDDHEKGRPRNTGRMGA